MIRFLSGAAVGAAVVTLTHLLIDSRFADHDRAAERRELHRVTYEAWCLRSEVGRLEGELLLARAQRDAARLDADAARRQATTVIPSVEPADMIPATSLPTR